nr:serine protease inhibitor, Kazal-type family protein [Ipomoea batatas]
MISSSKPPFSLLVFTLLNAVFCLFTSVLAESSNNPLRLPSDQDDGDVCAMLDPPASCPIKCFRPDPVCGVDGVTYWCGCADAHCNGVQVDKLGFCDVGNGGSGPVSGQALLLALLKVSFMYAFTWELNIFWSEKGLSAFMKEGDMSAFIESSQEFVEIFIRGFRLEWNSGCLPKWKIGGFSVLNSHPTMALCKPKPQEVKRYISFKNQDYPKLCVFSAAGPSI